jgi:amino acid transporter
MLYTASAGLGLAVAVGSLGIASLAALTAWLPVLFVLLVVVIVLIEVFKDNKIQDWLERTLWGTYRDEYKKGDAYESSDFELKQFEAALQG